MSTTRETAAITEAAAVTETWAPNPAVAVVRAVPPVATANTEIDAAVIGTVRVTPVRVSIVGVIGVVSRRHDLGVAVIGRGTRVGRSLHGGVLRRLRKRLR